MEYNCCVNPAISILDYMWPLFTDKGDIRELRINRVCTRCYAHWAGPVDSVKQFTKAEWSKYIDDAFEINTAQWRSA